MHIESPTLSPAESPTKAPTSTHTTTTHSTFERGLPRITNKKRRRRRRRRPQRPSSTIHGNPTKSPTSIPTNLPAAIRNNIPTANCLCHPMAVSPSSIPDDYLLNLPWSSLSRQTTARASCQLLFGTHPPLSQSQCRRRHHRKLTHRLHKRYNIPTYRDSTTPTRSCLLSRQAQLSFGDERTSTAARDRIFLLSTYRIRQNVDDVAWDATDGGTIHCRSREQDCLALDSTVDLRCSCEFGELFGYVPWGTFCFLF